MDFGTIFLIALIAIVVVYVAATLFKKLKQAASGDPLLWAGEIRRFEKEDRREMTPPEVILFTGSSSINFWKTLAEDMTPLKVLNRGFGGSQIHQVTYYADRIVLPFKPRAVVLYAGENDVAGALFDQGKSPPTVLENFKTFCQTIHDHFPEIPIYFISIKPPKLRRKHWPKMQEANRLIESFCETDGRIRYVDVAPAMLDAEGNTRGDLFKWDGIHLNAKGYAVWTSIIKPVLEKNFPPQSQ